MRGMLDRLKRFASVGAIVVYLFLVIAPPAMASCPTADPCNASAGNNVCWLVPPLYGTWRCDLTVNGDTYDTEMYVVYGYDGDNYCAWGTAGNGYDFTCEIYPPSSVHNIQLDGGSHSDTFYLQYSTYDLDMHSGGGNMAVLVETGDDMDYIYGSRVDSIYSPT